MTARRRYKPMPPLTRKAERALRKALKDGEGPGARIDHRNKLVVQ